MENAMRMTRIASSLAALAIVMAASTVQSQNVVATTGKEIFLKNRCNSCHTVKAESIVKKASAEAEEDKGDRKSPDLSSIGKTKTAAWMAKYLMKLEKNEGELHRKKFRGTEAELKVVTAWLETMKTEEKKAK